MGNTTHIECKVMLDSAVNQPDWNGFSRTELVNEHTLVIEAGTTNEEIITSNVPVLFSGNFKKVGDCLYPVFYDIKQRSATDPDHRVTPNPFFPTTDNWPKNEN